MVKKYLAFPRFESLKKGIGLCPEDRKEEGIVGDLTIRENIILALQARHGWFKFIDTARSSMKSPKNISSCWESSPRPRTNW